MISELDKREINGIYGGNFNPGGIVGTALGGFLLGLITLNGATGSHGDYKYEDESINKLILIANTAGPTNVQIRHGYSLRKAALCMILFTAVHAVAMVAAEVVSGIVMAIKGRNY